MAVLTPENSGGERSGEPMPVDVVRLEPLWEVETTLRPSLPAVVGDPVQLQQVVLNLILNANDASRDVERHGGRLWAQPNASGIGATFGFSLTAISRDLQRSSG
ncbi:hypothetical protein [Sorangium sp. So ce1078]|uniref:hypothetical protein n=1 Tax=Sorangium sp. So ce1078 TaxID=3133329 RepID=UPI003F62E56C